MLIAQVGSAKATHEHFGGGGVIKKTTQITLFPLTNFTYTKQWLYCLLN